MQQLIAFVERIYEPAQLDGRFHIYNLFTIQNSRSTNAIDEFKRLVECGDYDPMSALVPVQELAEHPWILYGWGCDEDSFPADLLNVKARWLELISNSGVRCFGKEHPKGKGYYHPCPLVSTHRPGIIDDFVKIYQQNFIQEHTSDRSVHDNPWFRREGFTLLKWNQSDVYPWFVVEDKTTSYQAFYHGGLRGKESVYYHWFTTPITQSGLVDGWVDFGEEFDTLEEIPYLTYVGFRHSSKWRRREFNAQGYEIEGRHLAFHKNQG